jgi:hypothetical protein
VVSNITAIELEGTYAPATRSGMLLVHGVLASNYAIVRAPHYIVHDYAMWRNASVDRTSQDHAHWYRGVLRSLIVDSGLLDLVVVVM